MFKVIERNDYMGIVLREDSNYLFVASPSLSKISKKAQEAGILAGLTSKQMVAISGRGVARITTSQDYCISDECEFNEAVEMVRADSTPSNNNVLQERIVQKYMTDKKIDAMVEETTVLANAASAFDIVSKTALKFRAKVSALKAELENRAEAKDVSGMEAARKKVALVGKAIKDNEVTEAFVKIGNSLIADSEESFDADEYLGFDD